MRNAIGSVLLGIIVIMTFVGCEDDTATSSTAKISDHFPNRIGSQWIFEYRDSLSAIPDTVDLVIVEAGIAPDGNNARIWVGTFRHRTDTAGVHRSDTMWVAKVGNTVKVFRNRLPSLITYILPLEVGNSWTSGPGYHDTTTVTSVVNLIGYPGGLLNGGLMIRHTWDEAGVGPNQSRIVIVPGIGVVILEFGVTLFSPNPGPAYETWRILSFNIVE